MPKKKRTRTEWQKAARGVEKPAKTITLAEVEKIVNPILEVHRKKLLKCTPDFAGYHLGGIRRCDEILRALREKVK